MQVRWHGMKLCSRYEDILNNYWSWQTLQSTRFVFASVFYFFFSVFSLFPVNILFFFTSAIFRYHLFYLCLSCSTYLAVRNILETSVTDFLKMSLSRRSEGQTARLEKEQRRTLSLITLEILYSLQISKPRRRLGS